MALAGLDLAGAHSAGEALRELIGNRAVDAGKTAVLVVDLADGKVLCGHNTDVPYIPASIMKTVTIASLLDKADIDYRYHTKVYAEGKIKNGVLDGNILVEGSGDPSLNSRVEPESEDIIKEIETAMRKEGIRKVTGGIRVDESIFRGPSCPPSWAKGDLNQSYGTGSHGFNFENNSTGRSAVQNPAGVFASRLRSTLRYAGIEIGSTPVEGGKKKLLVDHESATMDEIMRSCMMRSDNLFAESMLRTLAAEHGEDGSTAKGAEIEKKFWKKKHIPIDSVEIIDGSGLSRSNRVTADFIGGILRHKSEDVDYASFFPLAGQDGTLKNFLDETPLDSYIALKTGSMNGIQCYAGYKLDEDYAPTHVVVVIMNALPKGRAAARQAVGNFLLEIFKD